MRRIATACAIALWATGTPADSNAANVTREAEAVGRRFPDPEVSFTTPGFRPGREDFTSHAEALAFLEALVRDSPHASLEFLGASQRGLPLPLLLLTASGRIDPRLPTVLIIGQQHGNEPAGGEAALVLAQQLAGPKARVLRRVNVLIIPRANPDGANAFTRASANGLDVNRDHLLLNTPEARAIAVAVRKYKPQVMLDLHEFTVAGRWLEKFGAVMKYDALLQPATVGNLDAELADHAQRDYVERIHALLAANGLTSFAYHTTGSDDSQDKTVSMGGVQPDTGRNVGGLRPAISLLIEARGVGIGRAHFLRRVHTQVLAANAIIEIAAKQGVFLIHLVQRAQARARQSSCEGNSVIEAQLMPTRRRLTFLDAATGQDLSIEVDWRAASPLNVVKSRSRPCGYLLSSNQAAAIERLQLLGVELHTVVEAHAWHIERYMVTRADDALRQDARGAIEDNQSIRKIEIRTEPDSQVVPPGTVYVSLAQPLAPLIVAALEPDSQNSFVSNRLLDLSTGELRRVLVKPSSAAIAGLIDGRQN
jgi:hypothetical protein